MAGAAPARLRQGWNLLGGLDNSLAGDEVLLSPFRDRCAVSTTEQSVRTKRAPTPESDAENDVDPHHEHGGELWARARAFDSDEDIIAVEAV